jgi:FkbM family methyltransferase
MRWLSAPSPAAREWRAVRGDQTLRLDYDLSRDSTVLDVGGFEGQWCSDIVAMYGCRVHVFEPVPEYAERIRRRFARNPRVTVHQFGLSSKDQTVTASLAEDATSHVRGNGNTVPIELRDACAVLEDLSYPEVDLMKVNIEGGEYELLAHLIDKGMIKRIRDLQVQFHVFVPDAVEKLEELRVRLAETHYPTYQFYFVWESWRRRDDARTEVDDSAQLAGI